tara:strand:+ start:9781 stop:12693 length:2913 start_codon:yes stop_codon:yes gene_type:complete
MADSLKLWNVIERDVFKENPVHDYERISYDVSLHLANTTDTANWQRAERKLANAPDINSINSKMFKGGVVTLIESASTITTMTDLYIEGITSPNKVTDTGFSTKWRMSVVQPLGVSLIENIYKAAAVLGIKNHYSHPFFLQVILKGRKADGELEVEIPNTRRLYCVYIKNIVYQVDVGSANYQIEGIRAGDLNNADDHQLVQKTTLENIDTMGDFLDSFQKEVNKQERHKLGSTKAILDQYVFRIDSLEHTEAPVSKINDSEIAADDKKDSRTLDFEGKMFAEIERNTTIKEVLERFMSRNKVMQKLIQATRDQMMDMTWAKKEIEKLKIEKYLFTISTHNELLNYDSLRRDYARKFIYTITVMPMISVTAAVRKEFDKKKAYTEKRVKSMIDRKILVKRYDYFNTGMNLDVLNFNINYNYQYVYGLDTMVGLFNKYSEAFETVINTANTSQELINKVKENSSDGTKEFLKATSSDSEDAEKLSVGEKYWIKVMQQRNLQNIREMFDSGTIEPDNNTLEAYNALVEDYNQTYKQYEELGGQEADHYHPILNPKKSPKLNALDTYTYHPRYGWGLPQSKNKNVSKLGAQNILAENLKDELYEEALKEDQGGTQFPTQFYERYVDPTNEGMIGVSSADGSGFNTLLRNAKVGSAEMVRVTMDIIGDPYWLDHPAYSNKDDGEKFPHMADYKKENCVLFCSLIPSEKDASTGYQKTLAQRNNEFLTAVYRVWKIEHKFSNGMFTQTLHMIRDAITDLSLLVDGDIAKPQDSTATNEGQVSYDSSEFTGAGKYKYEEKTAPTKPYDDKMDQKIKSMKESVKEKQQVWWNPSDVHGTITYESLKEDEKMVDWSQKFIRDDIHNFDNPDTFEDIKRMYDANVLGGVHNGAISLKDIHKDKDLNGDGNIDIEEIMLSKDNKSEAEIINEKRDKNSEVKNDDEKTEGKAVYVPDLKSGEELKLFNQMQNDFSIIKEIK